MAWRLALLYRDPRTDHEKTLVAWYTERKQQLERSLAATIQNGEYVTESDPVKVFIREWTLWAVQLIPSWRRHLEKGPRADGMARYQYCKGLPFLADLGGGVLLPQVYAASIRTGKVSFTDDLIFDSSKAGLFQLLLLPDTLEEAIELQCSIEDTGRISGGLVVSQEVTTIVQTSKVLYDAGKSVPPGVVRLATAEEFAADMVLCKNRPPPIYYDEYRIQKELKGNKFAIVRSDRFVFAACVTRDELYNALQRLPTALQLGPPS